MCKFIVWLVLYVEDITALIKNPLQKADINR